MAFNVGELQATLSLDTQGFKQALSEAKKSVQAISNTTQKQLQPSLENIEKAFGGLAIAGGASLAALGFGLSSVVKDYGEAEMASTRLAHITRTSVGATDEQIRALTDQAQALQDLGVVGDDTIMTAQGTLATFDLQTESIRMLTPAVLDYAVAEKGAGVSSEELRGLTNGLAQALQGNFTSLTRTGFVLDEETKSMIENGTETERVTALVKVLNSTYKGMNAQMRTTSAGGMQALKNSFSDMKESLGQAVIPAVNSLVQALIPATNAIRDFANAHPLVVRSATGLGLTLASVAFTIGTVGSVAMKARAMFASLGGAVASQIAIFGTLIAVAIAAAIAINAMMSAIGNYNAQVIEANGRGQQYAMISDRLRNGNEAQRESAKKLFWEMKNGGKATDSLGSKMANLGNTGSDSAKQVQDAYENMVEAINEENKNYKESLKDLVIEHSKTIKDIQKDINEENENFKRVQAEKEADLQKQLGLEKESHEERMSYFNEELNAEKESLNEKTKTYNKEKSKLVKKHDFEIDELQKKLDEEKSWGAGANQEILEDLQSRIDDENKDFAERMENIEDGYQDEVDQSKKKTEAIKSDITKEKQEYKRKYEDLKAERAKDYQDELNTHRKAISALTTRLNEEMTIKKRHEDDFARYKNAKLVDDIAKLKQNHTQRLAEIKKQYDKELASAKSTASGISGAFDNAYDDIIADARNANKAMTASNQNYWDKLYVGLTIIKEWFKKYLYDYPLKYVKDFWNLYKSQNVNAWNVVVNTLKGIANSSLDLLAGLINRWASKINELKNYIPVIKNMLPDLPTNFSMPHFAQGVENWEGGTAIVGERGPEIVELPKGSNVIPNERSRGMGGINIENFYAKSDLDLDLLLRKYKFFAL